MSSTTLIYDENLESKVDQTRLNALQTGWRCDDQYLASRLINAQPLPAHRPAADGWLIDD